MTCVDNRVWSNYTLIMVDNGVECYTCSVCNRDKELFPDGTVFRKGKDKILPSCGCACSHGYKYSRLDYENLIKISSGTNYRFLGWLSGDKHTAHSKFHYGCNLHGLKTARFWDWRTGCRCPECSKSGFHHSRIGYLYFIRWEGDDGCMYLKIGITNNINQRLRNLKKGCNLTPNLDKYYKYANGYDAEIVEGRLKKYIASSDTENINREIMLDGWTETVKYSQVVYDDLTNIVENYEVVGIKNG